MSAQTFQAPIGTRDILPPESFRWQSLIAVFVRHVENAGYGLVQSPMFEERGVFDRMGSGTDVVRKEMYDFVDRGDRQLALRPEGTASIVRAYVQHRPTTPFKAFYIAPNFRYERPQAGRYRQHHQMGIEAIGSADPDLDVEVIVLGWRFLQTIGLKNLHLKINSMGTSEDREGYIATLRSWLIAHQDELDPQDHEKIVEHPMRVLDSKRPQTIAVIRNAPKIAETMGTSAQERFARVCDGLTAAGVAYHRDPTLVRGLDYYTHTTFEIVSDSLDAAQSTVLGGGRYDGLVAQMGGPDTPGIGFGSGIERVLLACDAEAVFAQSAQPLDVFVVDTTGGEHARDLSISLRSHGLATDRAYDDRSMRAQMKAADRSGAQFAVIVGPKEVALGGVLVRDLRRATNEDGQQFVAHDDLIARLTTLCTETTHRKNPQ